MNIYNITPNKQKSLMLVKKSLAELVCDAVNLEVINYTLPEIQTLLDGITIGGHKLQDQKITLNQSFAWKKLFKEVEDKTFEIIKKYFISLYYIAGENEALEWGYFRSGSVTISGATYLPLKALELAQHLDKLLAEYKNIEKIYEKSIFLFLEMARIQLFYDVNKRMGRFIMNEYPVINVPASRQLEFNEKMIKFYESHDHNEMTEFVISCLNHVVISIMSQ